MIDIEATHEQLVASADRDGLLYVNWMGAWHTYLANALKWGRERDTLKPPIGANLAIGLAGFYILFVFYRGGGLLKAWLRTRAIAKRSYPAPILPHDIQRALGECTAAIGDLDVSVLFSDAVPVPVTIGSRRAVIILPTKLLEETDRDVLVTAIGHETSRRAITPAAPAAGRSPGRATSSRRP